MKAVVTIIDDDGMIIDKNKVLMPQREWIETNAFVKCARFAFEFRTIIRPELFRREEAAAEDAQDTIPVQSGAEHDMQ
jgi:hypothetical protein